MSTKSTVKTKAQTILTEKNTKIIPANIKKDVEIFNIVGTYEGEHNLIPITYNSTFKRIVNPGPITLSQHIEELISFAESDERVDNAEVVRLDLGSSAFLQNHFIKEYNDYDGSYYFSYEEQATGSIHISKLVAPYKQGEDGPMYPFYDDETDSWYIEEYNEETDDYERKEYNPIFSYEFGMAESEGPGVTFNIRFSSNDGIHFVPHFYYTDWDIETDDSMWVETNVIEYHDYVTFSKLSSEWSSIHWHNIISNFLFTDDNIQDNNLIPVTENSTFNTFAKLHTPVILNNTISEYIDNSNADFIFYSNVNTPHEENEAYMHIDVLKYTASDSRYSDYPSLSLSITHICPENENNAYKANITYVANDYEHRIYRLKDIEYIRGSYNHIGVEKITSIANINFSQLEGDITNWNDVLSNFFFTEPQQ